MWKKRREREKENKRGITLALHIVYCWTNNTKLWPHSTLDKNVFFLEKPTAK